MIVVSKTMRDMLTHNTLTPFARVSTGMCNMASANGPRSPYMFIEHPTTGHGVTVNSANLVYLVGVVVIFCVAMAAGAAGAAGNIISRPVMSGPEASTSSAMVSALGGQLSVETELAWAAMAPPPLAATDLIATNKIQRAMGCRLHCGFPSSGLPTSGS